MDWKRSEIEKRRDRISQQVIELKGRPFPWWENETECSSSLLPTPEDFEYRVVELSGILDGSREILVGPRTVSFATTNSSNSARDNAGYQVYQPLILKDGSELIVNRGFLSLNQLMTLRATEEVEHWKAAYDIGRSSDPKFPEFSIDRIPRQTTPTGSPYLMELPHSVRIRGVLTMGEKSATEWWRVKNRPSDGKFNYGIVKEMAQTMEIASADQQEMLVVAEAVSFLDDRKNRYLMKKSEDFLLFYGDEHTHLWYAVQWFASAAVLATMTIWRCLFFFRNYRW